MDQKIYRTIRIKNSILNPGKEFEVSFTKKQYRAYLIKIIAWRRIVKIILVIIGLIGLWVFTPLFLVCGVICLIIDFYALLKKQLSWYFIIVYPLDYLIVQSWQGLIYASFVLGSLNIVLNGFFLKPYEIDITKINAKTKVI